MAHRDPLSVPLTRTQGTSFTSIVKSNVTVSVVGDKIVMTTVPCMFTVWVPCVMLNSVIVSVIWFGSASTSASWSAT